MKCHEELKSRECRLRTDLPHLLLVAGGLAQRGEDELAPLHDLVRDAVEQRVVVGDGAGIERRAARRDLVRAELLVVREVHGIEEVWTSGSILQIWPRLWGNDSRRDRNGCCSQRWVTSNPDPQSRMESTLSRVGTFAAHITRRLATPVRKCTS